MSERNQVGRLFWGAKWPAKKRLADWYKSMFACKKCHAGNGFCTKHRKTEPRGS